MHKAIMHKTTAVQQHTGRIEELIRKLESSADPDSLATARELVQSLMELYGAGLDRITEVAQKSAAGREILDELGRDELVGNLLAANGLHPLDLDTRVRRAVEKLGARVRAPGRLDFLGFVKSAVEEAMYEAAPDLVHLAIEVVEEQGAAAGFVPLEKLAGYRATNGVSANGNGAGV
jgi:hypothetical protein